MAAGFFSNFNTFTNAPHGTPQVPRHPPFLVQTVPLFLQIPHFIYLSCQASREWISPTYNNLWGGWQLVDSNVAIETIDPCKPWGMLAAVLGNATKEISINMRPYETVAPGQGKKRKLGDSTYEGAQVCLHVQMFASLCLLHARRLVCYAHE